MATLRKREDRGNRYELSYMDIDKRRYRIDTGTTDLKVARVWLRKAEELLSQAKLGEIDKVGRVDADVVARQNSEAGMPSISDFKEYYEERCRHDLELSDSTIDNNNIAFDTLIRIVGDKQMHQIFEEDVMTFKKALAKEGKSPTTNAIYHRHLRSAWSRAVKYKIVPDNPFMAVATAKVRPNKKERLKSKDMSFEEVQKLLKYLEKVGDTRFGYYIRFLLYTGCRRNEILFLEWEDVDLENETLTVYSSKGRKTLILPISNALKRTIDTMIKKSSGYIFVSNSNRTKKGKPWSEDFVTHHFKKRITELDLPNHYTLHSLRHTYVTLLRTKGIPNDIIQKLVGHASARVTSEHYDQSLALHFRDQANLVDFETEA